MERKEQGEWTLNSSVNKPQDHTVQAEEACLVPNTTKQRKYPCHAVIGARPYCSPEYSPDFHKLGSTLSHSTFSVSYAEKKRLLEKQEEIKEVKQLDEWKPAVSVFTAVLEKLQDKTS